MIQLGLTVEELLVSSFRRCSGEAGPYGVTFNYAELSTSNAHQRGFHPFHKTVVRRTPYFISIFHRNVVNGI
jgi:hypothetical protein